MHDIFWFDAMYKWGEIAAAKGGECVRVLDCQRPSRGVVLYSNSD